MEFAVSSDAKCIKIFTISFFSPFLSLSQQPYPGFARETLPFQHWHMNDWQSFIWISLWATLSFYSWEAEGEAGVSLGRKEGKRLSASPACSAQGSAGDSTLFPLQSTWEDSWPYTSLLASSRTACVTHMCALKNDAQRGGCNMRVPFKHCAERFVFAHKKSTIV